MRRRLFSLWPSRRGQLSCAAVLEVLQSYLDGEIDAEEARRVAHHLERCSPCEREAVVYQRIKVSLVQRRVIIDPTVHEALTLFGERVARGESV